MKKSNNIKPNPKKSNLNNVLEKKSQNTTDGIDSDTETGTFSSWLRSGEGTELMKLFVIGNSIIVFITMSWPHLKQMFGTIYEMLTEDTL